MFPLKRFFFSLTRVRMPLTVRTYLWACSAGTRFVGDASATRYRDPPVTPPPAWPQSAGDAYASRVSRPTAFTRHRPREELQLAGNTRAPTHRVHPVAAPREELQLTGATRAPAKNPQPPKKAMKLGDSYELQMYHSLFS